MIIWVKGMGAQPSRSGDIPRSWRRDIADAVRRRAWELAARGRLARLPAGCRIL